MAHTTLDVLVIGGGITGAGVALDAASRGYRVGLVEQGDFASGTSGWSTKLVHGGIRYLPQGDVPLVREALRERGRLLRNAPQLVRPLTFVLPLYASSRHPVGLPIAPPGGVGLPWILDLGLTAYDLLAGKYALARHQRLAANDLLARARCLRPEGLRLGFTYTDAQTDDTRLTLAILRAAADAGALLASYAQVVGFEADATGRVRAAQVRLLAPGDGAVGEEVTLTARHVVNATGVFAQQVEALAGGTPRLRIEPSKGVHLVVAREALDIGSEAIVLPETPDRRLVFIVPWRSRVLIGTTDTGGGELAHPRAEAADVAFLLEAVNRWVRRPLTPEDVLGVYAGYRPLLRLHQRRTPARLSRTHVVVEGAQGLVSVSGGKLTTYRAMAQGVVDRLVARDGEARPCRTATLPVAGAAGWAEDVPAFTSRATALGLAAATATHLSAAYGTLAHEVLDLVRADPTLGAPLYPDLPTIWAEVHYAARHELALTIADVLERRLRIGVEAADAGAAVAPAVAAILADILHWDEAERQRQLAAYDAYRRLHVAGLRPALPDPVD